MVYQPCLDQSAVPDAPWGELDDRQSTYSAFNPSEERDLVKLLIYDSRAGRYGGVEVPPASPAREDHAA